MKKIFCFLVPFLFSCTQDKGIAVYNAAPEATFVSHSSGDGVFEGSTVEFVAALTDANHSVDELIAAWYADDQEQCGFEAPNAQGDSSCFVEISAQLSEIKVEVRDPKNAVGQAILNIEILQNEEPVAQILSPTVEGSYVAGSVIAFEAIISDQEDDSELLTIDWSSSLDGSLSLDGTLESSGYFQSSAELSEGTHTISLSVQDTSGKEAEDSVEITVGPANQPPTAIGIDIQNSAGTSVTEAYDGSTLYCIADFNDLEGDPFTLRYEWTGPQNTILNANTLEEQFTIDFAAQNLQPSDELTCTVFATDGLGETSQSDTVTLLDCSPFATEIPYDNIDSNCDGLEYLNDADQDGVADNISMDFDDDDDHADADPANAVGARLGVECYGLLRDFNGEEIYILYCDNDLYWKSADSFCKDNGYDSLITMGSMDQFNSVVEQYTSIVSNYTPPIQNVAWQEPWVGLTRGPDCAPMANTNTGYPSICSSNTQDYYWVDGTPTSWFQNNLSSVWYDSELSATNSVEHCAYLNMSEPGFFDLYCDYASSGPHMDWSRTHTKAAVCMLRVQ